MVFSPAGSPPQLLFFWRDPLCGMAQAAATPAAPGFSGMTWPVMEIDPGLT
jgi:hypothetical protein